MHHSLKSRKIHLKPASFRCTGYLCWYPWKARQHCLLRYGMTFLYNESYCLPHVNSYNRETLVCVVRVVSFAVSMVNAATIDSDEASLLYALRMPYLRLGNIVESNASTYLRYLSDAQQRKMVSRCLNRSQQVSAIYWFVTGTGCWVPVP